MQGTGREARKSAVCIFGISKEIDRYSSRRSAVGCSNYYKEKKRAIDRPSQMINAQIKIKQNQA